MRVHSSGSHNSMLHTGIVVQQKDLTRNCCSESLILAIDLTFNGVFILVLSALANTLLKYANVHVDVIVPSFN